MTDKTTQQNLLDELRTSIKTYDRLIRDLRKQARDLQLGLMWAIDNIGDDLDLDAQETEKHCLNLIKQAIL